MLGLEEVVVLDAGQLFRLDVLCVAPRLGGGGGWATVVSTGSPSERARCLRGG